MLAAWPLQMARTCLIRQRTHTQTESKIFRKLISKSSKQHYAELLSIPAPDQVSAAQRNQRGQWHLVPTRLRWSWQLDHCRGSTIHHASDCLLRCTSPHKADITTALIYVRFGGRADIPQPGYVRSREQIEVAASPRRLSMQFHLRFGAPVDQPNEGVERDFDEAVQRIFVHFVQRHVHQPREIAFDKETAADQLAHQAADRAVFTERHQRAEVAVIPGLNWLPAELSRQLFCQVRRLLMCGLCARRYEGFPFRP